MSEEELWADDLVREHHAKERTFGWKSKDDDEEGLFPEARTVSKSNVAPQIRQSLSNSNTPPLTPPRTPPRNSSTPPRTPPTGTPPRTPPRTPPQGTRNVLAPPPRAVPPVPTSLPRHPASSSTADEDEDDSPE